MNTDHSQLRATVGALAKQYFDGALDFKAFFNQLPSEATESDDPDIEELLDLIEHEPAIGWFLGVSEGEHARYRERMRKVILRLQGNENQRDIFTTYSDT